MVFATDISYSLIERNILGDSKTYKSIQLERVWIAVYGRGSMYDLAWELRNYEEGNEEPEIYTIVPGLGVGQLEANRKCRKENQQSKLTQIQGKFGHKSPYGDSYR